MLGDLDVVRSLVAHGAPLDDASCGETALHAAIAERQRDTAELLVRAGANVNAPNMNGRTPMHFLPSALDDEALARLMIEHGGDVHARDLNGRTPLDYASLRGADGVDRAYRAGPAR